MLFKLYTSPPVEATSTFFKKSMGHESRQCLDSITVLFKGTLKTLPIRLKFEVLRIYKYLPLFLHEVISFSRLQNRILYL